MNKITSEQLDTDQAFCERTKNDIGKFPYRSHSYALVLLDRIRAYIADVRRLREQINEMCGALQCIALAECDYYKSKQIAAAVLQRTGLTCKK